MSSNTDLRISAPSSHHAEADGASSVVALASSSLAPMTPPRSPPASGGQRSPPGAPQKCPKNGHKALIFGGGARAQAEDGEFVPLDQYRPCRSCSAYFDMRQSADSDHCSAACSANCPPYSAVPVGIEPMRPATAEEWMAFNGTRAPTPPASPTPLPSMTAQTGNAELCQHWWPRNAPHPCSDCSR